MTDIPIAAATKSTSRDAQAAKLIRKRTLGRAGRHQSRLKLQVDFPGGTRLGPGKVALLEAIERAGSLSRAAEDLKLSYRRAWLFMQQINAAFDEPAVSTPEHGHGGGPAKLTPFGRELIRQYRSLEQEAARAGQQLLAWLDRHHSEKQDPGVGGA